MSKCNQSGVKAKVTVEVAVVEAHREDFGVLRNNRNSAQPQKVLKKSRSSFSLQP
jgi:hypothetical protein